MAGLGRARVPSARAVEEGEWIRVKIEPGFPVSMRIDSGPVEPAFIDRVKENGEIVTYAVLKSPKLRRGTHRVQATTPTGQFDATFESP